MPRDTAQCGYIRPIKYFDSFIMDCDAEMLRESMSKLPDIRRLDIDFKKDVAELCTEAIGAVVVVVASTACRRLGRLCCVMGLYAGSISTVAMALM